MSIHYYYVIMGIKNTTRIIYYMRHIRKVRAVRNVGSSERAEIVQHYLLIVSQAIAIAVLIQKSFLL